MMNIRSILRVLFLMLLHNNVYSQEKPDTSAKSINFKVLPLTRLLLTDSLYVVCGYYDSSNNILYDCNGKITLDKPDKVIGKITDSLCCSLRDTDGDGVNDEIDKCINKKGPASNFGCPILSPEVIVHYPAMPTVFFPSSSSYLSSKSIKALKTTVKFLNDWPDFNVNLDGHTDNIGSDELNRNLCMARIKAVRSYLQKAGIDKSRITYSIYGSKYPIGDYRTKEGQAMNRRVEISTYKKRTDK